MNTVDSFLPPPAPGVAAELRALAPGQVALWLWNLDAAGPVTPAHLAQLSSDERSRARKLRWPMLQRWFVLGRSCVRETLGRITGLAPSAVRFISSSQGKPFLPAALSRDSRMRFNWSHSGQMLLLGVTFGAEIGVGLEQVRPLPSLHDLASPSLPRATQAALHSLPEEQRLVAFYRARTRREAVAKARGVDLAGTASESGLKIFEVETECGGGPVVGAVAIASV